MKSKKKFIVQQTLNWNINTGRQSTTHDVVFQDGNGFTFIVEFAKRKLALACVRAFNKAGLKP